MFERLREVAQEIRDVVSWIRRERLGAEDAVSLLNELGRIENTCASARVLLSRRIAESTLWQDKGERSAAHFVARATRTTVAKAVETLETAKHLEELPSTTEAFQEGRVSETQAKEIASAASMNPSSEQTLLETARTGDVIALRDACRRVRHAAVTDELERYEAIHRSRYLRSWSDHDGAFRLDAKLTPDAGATVMAALEPHRRRAFEDARKAGRKDRPEAYLADALVSLAEEGSSPNTKGTSGPRAMVHVRVDHTALLRGHRKGAETCEIAGIGPIPVATARALASDAILAAVLTEGADVKAVAHLGRTIPARLRTALQARDTECAVPGCHNRHRLEIDHIEPFAEGGPTSLDNLVRLCRPHHHMKTNLGFRLVGGPGKWKWISPDETAATAERSPP
jgi:Domain of unknown function (DUF222)/HNH endonuclease